MIQGHKEQNDDKEENSKIKIQYLESGPEEKIFGYPIPMILRINISTNYIVKKAEITCEIIKILGKLGDPQAPKGKYNSPHSTVLYEFSEML